MIEANVKVARPGEGKTKWLVRKGYEAVQSNKYSQVVYFGDVENYINFCDMYALMFKTCCPIVHKPLSATQLEGCVLIDDLLRKSFNTPLTSLLKYAQDAYITITGTEAVGSENN